VVPLNIYEETKHFRHVNTFQLYLKEIKKNSNNTHRLRSTHYHFEPHSRLIRKRGTEE